MTNEKTDMLKAAYNGSYYTITGVGGKRDEWINGYNKLMKEQGIGEVPAENWIEFSGQDMNVIYHLKGNVRYPNNLCFLAFPIDGLNVNKLAMFKLEMQDRWFDDIVENNKWHNGDYDEEED